jgi:hypothetical protein
MLYRETGCALRSECCGLSGAEEKIMHTTGLLRFTKVLIAAGAAAFISIGCGPSDNACVGVGPEPDLDSCFQDENDAASCGAFNTEGLNGDTWTFHDGKTCSDEGFLYECPSGTYKLSDSYCGF